MVRDAAFAAIGLVVLGALGPFALRGALLRARVGRFEPKGPGLFRPIATVQGRAEPQIRAVRGELTIARVNDSAAEGMAILTFRGTEEGRAA